MYVTANPQRSLAAYRGQMVMPGRGALRGLGAYRGQMVRPGRGALRGVPLGAYRGQMARPGRGALRGLGAPSQTGQVAKSTGIAAAATAASFIPVVGPVVGAIIGAVGGAIFGASARRAAQAKTENAAVNQLMPAAISSIQGIVAQVQAGQLDPASASAQLDQIVSDFASAIQQFSGTPGSAMTPCAPVAGGGCANSAGYGSTKCDKNCTVGCCMLCSWLQPTICRIKELLASPTGGTISIPPSGGSGYGYSGTSGFSVSYTPAIAGAGVSGALSSITSGTTLGMPTWIWFVAGGGLIVLWYLSQSQR